MTTPFAVDAPRLQPRDSSESRLARDVSITDYTWAASPHIFGNYVLSQPHADNRTAANHTLR